MENMFLFYHIIGDKKQTINSIISYINPFEMERAFSKKKKKSFYLHRRI